LNEVKDKSTLMIVVKTNANETKLKEYDAQRRVYLMDVAASPTDNKANEEIKRYFKKEIGRNMRIISGATSKKKLIRSF